MRVRPLAEESDFALPSNDDLKDEEIIQRRKGVLGSETHRHSFAIVIEVEYFKEIESFLSIAEANGHRSLRPSLQKSERERAGGRDVTRLTTKAKPNERAAETSAWSSGDCA